MPFSRHIDVMLGKALAMLGFVKRFSLEFRDPYLVKILYVSLLRLDQMNGGLFMTCTSIACAEKEILIAMTDIYVDRCTLIHLDTLAERRSYACVMFVFKI
jgi:hypothetical protein